MSISKIIKYRNVWMGIAIIWVIMFHSSFIINNSILRFIKYIGYGGVDIFIFASGLGCYYSLNKDSDINKFLKRRFKKLIPTFWCFLIFYFIFKIKLGNMPINAIVGNIFCIQSFTNKGNSFNWYICAIWLLYILAPYFYNHTNKIKNIFETLIFVLFLVILSVPFFKNYNYLIMVTRIPLFFIGMCFARLSLEKDYKLSKKDIIILIILMLIGFIILKISFNKYLSYLSKYGLFWYPYILITPGLCITISLLCNLIDTKKIGNLIVKLFNYIGNNTFELYLTHLLVFNIVKLMYSYTIIKSNSNILWLISIMISIVCAILLKYYTKLSVYLFEKIHNKCMNKKLET